MSSPGVPGPLQVLVGWALAAGIVPVQVTVVGADGLAGTATEWDGGDDASDRTAANTAAAPTSAAAAASFRPRLRKNCMLVSPPSW
jgi:hypothetical protein